MKKLIIILFLLFPFLLFSQSNNEKYQNILSYIQDSIINENEPNNYFVSRHGVWKTGFSDFIGMSEQCEIQHRLLLEILLNGEESVIKESEINIPDELKNKSTKYKIELGTIISYQKIWCTIIILNDLSDKEYKWTKYSLIFIDDKLAGQMIGEWHAD